MTQQETDRYNELSALNQQLITEIQDLHDTITEKIRDAKHLQRQLGANIAEMRYLSLSSLERSHVLSSNPPIRPVFRHPILRLKLWGNDGGV